MCLAARAGMRKAKVTLARKLAVVSHRMLADATSFLADRAAVAAARKHEEICRFGRTGRPEQGPVAGTTDQVRPMTFQQSVANVRC
jgi:hypothetical protein